LLIICSNTYAQSFPTKPIRIVTGGAGGVLDFSARLIAQELTASMGQQVIVENRATGVVSGDIVSRASPDGHTLILTGSTLWIVPLLQKTAFDPLRDFAPITLTVSTPNVVIVHPSVPAKTIRELIAVAKEKPGALNYGTSGVGTANHLSAELFNLMAGVNIVRVSYKSPGASLNDVIAGQVQLMFASAPTIAAHIKSGRLRALAVTSLKPSALAPDLPTVSDSGLPGYEMATLNGLLAPAHTPAALINRLHREVVRAMNKPDIKERLFAAGVEVVGSTPAELTAVIKAESVKIAKLIRDADIRGEQ
jgi:tripartite-type tricarboxylate transporter receptor subunit TctC